MIAFGKKLLHYFIEGILMIKKIVNVKNIGSYQDNICVHCGSWNGEFKQINIIYGENGAGKTTLSLLLRSLKGNNFLLKEKRSFGSTGIQKVDIITPDNIYCFNDGKWNKHYSNIEIFDIHFIEDNIYIGSSLLSKTKSNLFEVIVGEEGLKIKYKLTELYKQNNFYRTLRRRAKNKLKYMSKELSDDMKVDIQKEIDECTNKIGIFGKLIKEANVELGEYSKSTFDNHIGLINKYLRFFTPYIEVKKFSKICVKGEQYVSYSLSVGGERVVFNPNSKNWNIKYTLSEGDKSSFAFAFFLAKLELQDLSEKIVIFDDPISSFDHARRNATINQLMQIGQKCKQLFVFTHDINFAKTIFQRCNSRIANSLQILKKNNRSSICFHDIENETLTGVFKDIQVLNNYLVQGASNELEKREVVRCIRPIIEGIIRIKFFTEIIRTDWLGDIIVKVRESDKSKKIFRLKPYLDEICEINDYSKYFHHSDPTNPWGDIINDEELRLYVSRTIALIDSI